MLKLSATAMGIAAAVALTALAGGAQAAPGIAAAAKVDKPGTSSVEKAAYRRCWYRHGVRHCRWVNNYDPYYYGPYYGYGPSFDLYIGRGGRGHGHGGHGHGGHGGHGHRR